MDHEQQNQSSIPQDSSATLVWHLENQIGMYKKVIQEGETKQKDLMNLLKISLNRNESEKETSKLFQLISRVDKLEQRLQKAHNEKAEMHKFHRQMMCHFHKMMDEREEALKVCQQKLQDVEEELEDARRTRAKIAEVAFRFAESESGSEYETE
jgi:translation initiation factor 2B subunit (eIF-2B alpha/beta/delta family)